MKNILSHAHRGWSWLEHRANKAYTPAYNPLYHLGAIGVFLIWILIISGIYLFIFYEISARGAYLSVKYLTQEQWYLGGMLRSLHHYGADLLIIITFLHLIHTFVTDRYKHWRWLAWVSGVALLWFIWISGIFGYWMVWDTRAQLVALLSAEMLEKLPIFGQPLSIALSGSDTLSDQLFYIILFIHFSVPVVLFIFLWIHVKRITKAKINPPAALSWVVIGFILALSIIKPAKLGPGADLGKLPVDIPFNWFYLFIYPALKHISAPSPWVAIIAATVFVACLPWIGRNRRLPAAFVLPSNCVGCGQCAADCPYEAISMAAKENVLPEAAISAKNCAGCGICVGACDYMAINLPDWTEDAMKQKILRLSQELKESGSYPTIFTFVCARGVELKDSLKDIAWTKVISVPCIGMLKPSTAAIPIEAGIHGVFIAGCQAGDCYYRFGNEWLAQRLKGIRRPVPAWSFEDFRVKSAGFSNVETGDFLMSLNRFREEIRGGCQR
ncbi:MAG: cytochrome b N-terminal domain-containing protein [Deltaproteobacteria bacterium]|nr:cytochrome b N-terminal domain-containing protein [Deltaproteobacteria bacterium]